MLLPARQSAPSPGPTVAPGGHRRTLPARHRDCRRSSQREPCDTAVTPSRTSARACDGAHATLRADDRHRRRPGSPQRRSAICPRRPARDHPPARRSGVLVSRPRGTTIRDQATLERIRALAIPPAWTDVWICPDPERPHPGDRAGRARAQAVSLPSASGARRRDETKFDRMRRLRARPCRRIRARCDADLARRASRARRSSPPSCGCSSSR